MRLVHCIFPLTRIFHLASWPNGTSADKRAVRSSSLRVCRQRPRLYAMSDPQPAVNLHRHATLLSLRPRALHNTQPATESKSSISGRPEEGLTKTSPKARERPF